MKDKINCGSACVNYILNQLKLPIKNVQNDMVWTSELAVSLKNNGINNLEVLFFNSSLYNGYKTDYKRDFIGFNLLDDLIGHNIKLSERRLTVKELEKEIINNKYIILCVESKKFNKDKKMTAGHFSFINSLENNLVNIVNPIKEKYETKKVTKVFLINCCKHYGSWRILIRG